MADKFNRAFIRKVGRELERTAIDRMDAIALQAHSLLVQTTPVDFGQARAGWNFSTNKMDETVPPDDTKKGKKRGTKVYADPPEPNPNARSYEDRYHISNFVKHIVYLNEGPNLSVQAPEPKWVERAVASAVDAVESSREF